MKNKKKETNKKEQKICKKCNKNKLIFEFYKSKNQKDGFESLCKKCKSDYEKNRWDLIKEDKKKVMKEYYILNKIEHNKRTQKHFKENKEYYREYWIKNKERKRKWRKNKYDNDPSYKMRHVMSNAIKEKIKNRGGIKLSKFEKLVGNNIEFVRNYLQLKFYPEMNWENHGEIWEIDHIIPCHSFDLTKLEEQQKCFHYTNLQPLFKTTSIAESFGYFGIMGNRNKYNKII